LVEVRALWEDWVYNQTVYLFCSVIAPLVVHSCHSWIFGKILLQQSVVAGTPSDFSPCLCTCTCSSFSPLHSILLLGTRSHKMHGYSSGVQTCLTGSFELSKVESTVPGVFWAHMYARLRLNRITSTLHVLLFVFGTLTRT
jgi:hypothetical protein